jgi:hypothetical protein
MKIYIKDADPESRGENSNAKGFGSQGENGRQCLTQAINMIEDDFACILVIMRIDELKMFLPN